MSMDFRMSQTIYNPSDHKWKTPAQIRSISLPNIPNKKYYTGLRIIEKIIEIKGAKKFKQRNVSTDQAVPILDLQNLKFEDAQKEFRRMTNTTHYAQVFGQKPKMQEDYEILKYKKFTDLQISTILKHQPCQFVESWLSLNDQQEFTGQLYLTLRDIYTVIRNQQPPKSLASVDYVHSKQDANAKAPRYDKLILQHKGKKPVQQKRIDIQQELSILKRLNLSLNRKNNNMKYQFAEPIIDPKQFKQNFFQGCGNITAYCELNDPKITDYQETFKGKQIYSKFDEGKKDFNTSCCIGGVIPDPAFMSKTTQKFENYKNELKTITQRFLRTAQETMDNRSMQANQR
ncbi:UNKNOWN [Stylonychia lemnae]|uniref:Uncharacterized protein n=1 Tax=Stylonychia lemnae TaxID=5949 RepID=A0A078AJR9_STYLE|nr:UNKNOWN [Stylonychia lemnae]|eukprot:CDW82414.1 UNKNOWN [Stylonychia lemnae]